MIKLLPTKYRIIYLVIFVLGLLKVLNTGAIFYPDSYAFLDMQINRSPVYSLFLKLTTTVFGDYYEVPVLVLQYLFFAFAINYLLKSIKSKINLSAVGILLIQFSILINGLYFYLSVNRVLSEAIVFPLILIFIAEVFKLLSNKTLKNSYKLIVVFFVLLFTRGQFLAFLPLLILALVYVVYQSKNYKKGFIVLCLTLATPFLSSLLEKTYNKIVIGEFKGYAMTYVHFITNPFYIANAEDKNLFSNSEEKAFFNRTYNLMLDKKITRNQAIQTKYVDDYLFFENNFSKICNASIHQANMDYYGTQGYNYLEQQYKVDQITSSMFLPLLKANFKTWVRMVVKSFIKGFGGIQMCLALGLLLLYCIMFFKDNTMLFLGIAITLKVLNGIIIAMVVHSIYRYTFYFDWVLLAAFILILDSKIKKA